MIKPMSAEISFASLIHAPREKVYDAFTIASEMDQWFTQGARIDARPGGSILIHWENWGVDRYTGEDGGPVLEAKRPERFVFQWHPHRKDYATMVEINFEERKDGTVVCLRETGFEDSEEGLKAILGNAGGWGEALTLLKFYIEHGVTY
jgi:uncharacterized protein YndB with AHSA1/START domain